MNTAELQALREACDYADRKQNPTVIVPVSLLRSIIADAEYLCSIRRFEGPEIHDHPDVNPCPECGMGRRT